MAKNNSFIRLEGTLDGLTFYRKDGENFVKTKSSVSKNRIMNDPAFRRTRENMQEFSGAARAGKAFRSAFGSVIKLMGDTYISGRLTALMKRINRLGTGVRGERVIDVTANPILLEHFEFNKLQPFSATFFATYDPPTLNVNRDAATWVVPDFDTDTFINTPEGATHFKLLLSFGLLSNYNYNRALEGYEPDAPEEDSLGTTAYSAAIPIGGMVGAATTLDADLGIGTPVSLDIASIAAIGIVFYQEINTELYELAQGNAMVIATVG